MTRRAPLLLALAAASLSLVGCGLTPLYAGGQGGRIANTLRSISVDPIEGETGWIVRDALRQRLAAAGTSVRDSGARYRLAVRLDDRISGLGVRLDDTVSRERRTLRARWQLIDAASGETLLDATSGTDAGIDVVGSEYATIAAERTALERLAEALAGQMVARVAAYAATGATAGEPTPAPSR